MSDDNNDRVFLLGLIVGGLVGAGTVFLFGTEKGAKVRKELKKKSEEAKEDLEETLKNLEVKGREVKEKAEKISKEIAERADEFREDFGGEVGEKLDKTLANIETLQERGREATAAIRKKYFLKDGKKLA